MAAEYQDQFVKVISARALNGVISGNFNLTKVGRDTVMLGGQNNYQNTVIEDGMLRIAIINALPVSGTLTTKGVGKFDLNGFDQTLAGLADANNVIGASGTILNSAPAIRTLTIAGAANSTYAGLIDGGIRVTKTGAGTLTLLAPNTYFGGTNLVDGVMTISADANLGAARGAVTFNGGTLLAIDTFASQRDYFLASVGGIINVEPTKTLTLAGSVAGNLGVGLTKTGDGTLLQQAIFAHFGPTTIEAGTLRANTVDGLPTSQLLAVNAAGVFDMNGLSQTIGNLGGTGSDALVQNLGSTATLNLGGDGTDSTFDGQIQGNIELTKSGGGVFTLNQNAITSAIAGGVNVAAGTLRINGTLDSGNGVVVLGGAVLGGSGVILDTVTLNTGSTLAPGNSPGNLTTNSEVWNAGSTFQFEINDGTLSATEGANWDIITLLGTLTINADTTNRINIEIDSLTPFNASGALDGWDSNGTYTNYWRFANANSIVLNSSGDPAATLENIWNFKLGGFTSFNAAPGSFFVSYDLANNDLYMNYDGSVTAVPEPGSLLLAGMFALGFAGFHWKRSRSKTQTSPNLESATLIA